MSKKDIPVHEPRPDEYELPSAQHGDTTGLIEDDEQERDPCSGIIPYRAG